MDMLQIAHWKREMGVALVSLFPKVKATKVPKRKVTVEETRLGPRNFREKQFQHLLHQTVHLIL
jgi:hypothetical protein